MIKFLQVLAALGILGASSLYIILNFPSIAFNHSIIFGSNNKVEQRIETPTASPKPTTQIQPTPIPVATPKETSVNKEETTKDETTTVPNDVTTNTGSKPTYSEPTVVKTQRSPKYQPAPRNLNAYYQDTSNNNDQETFDSRQNKQYCPTKITVKTPIQIEDYDEDKTFQDIRPTTNIYSRSEQRQEIYSNGVRTVRRTVTITTNQGTTTRVYDY